MIDPGDDFRPEKKLGAVTSLLLVVDAHAMALEGAKSRSPVTEPVPDDASSPLCAGNLSLAVLKKNVLEK